MSLSASGQEWNERQKRSIEYHDREGRALRDIERQLQEISRLLVALCAHLGAGGRR